MDQYTKLAKEAIEAIIGQEKELPLPKDLPQEMLSEKAGVFVTIHNGSDLRGCIGTYLPTEDCVAQEIIQNAISASTKDSRFNKITKDELKDLSYEVSLLKEPEQIKSIDMLDVKKYGLLVRTHDGKSGLLLPDLKGVNSSEEQISICCQKGGINPEKETLILYRFEVLKYT